MARSPLSSAPHLSCSILPLPYSDGGWRVGPKVYTRRWPLPHIPRPPCRETLTISRRSKVRTRGRTCVCGDRTYTPCFTFHGPTASPLTHSHSHSHSSIAREGSCALGTPAQPCAATQIGSRRWGRIHTPLLPLRGCVNGRDRWREWGQ